MSLPRRSPRPAPGRARRRSSRACLSALTVAPAHAAAYRYWGFYQLTDGAWAFAQKGSDQTVPADGRVDGWRFAVADDSLDPLPARRPDLRRRSAARPLPRPARSGSASSSTSGARPMPPTARPRPSRRRCAPSSPRTPRARPCSPRRGDVRTEKGLVCGVAGYPASDCGGAVKEVSAEAKAADKPVTIAAPGRARRPRPRRPPPPTGTDVAAAQASGTSGYERGGIRHRGARPARPHRLPARALTLARPAGRLRGRRPP